MNLIDLIPNLGRAICVATKVTEKVMAKIPAKATEMLLKRIL